MIKLRSYTPFGSTAATTSTLFLAANERRKFAEIVNASDVDMWLALGEAAVLGEGIYLKPGFAYEINESNLWCGAVYGLFASGSGKSYSGYELT